MVQFPDETVWTHIETIDLGASDSHQAAREDFLARHPELADKLDWLRIDFMCARDGSSALRFSVSDRPPTVSERRLP
jgi:hypothetical protein